MLNKKSLAESLELLTKITDKIYNSTTKVIANDLWQKQLQVDNPLWKHVNAKSFSVNQGREMGHVIAIVDNRLPGLGLVGFFGATTMKSGLNVIEQATKWLKDEHDIREVYGPINGTITNDYRFNLDDNFVIPGEPVNPKLYIEIFKQAGFEPYNSYVSGIAKHPQIYMRLVTRRKPKKTVRPVRLEPFESSKSNANIERYHKLMNAIFPSNSIYCPIITLEERKFNMAKSNYGFDPKYCYFAYSGDQLAGFITAFPYQDSLVLKTIGVLPEFRGQRISDVLVRRVHAEAKKDKLKSAIYSTTRTTTTVYKKRHIGVKVFRHYLTMKKYI